MCHDSSVWASGVDNIHGHKDKIQDTHNFSLSITKMSFVCKLKKILSDL